MRWKKEGYIMAEEKRLFDLKIGDGHELLLALQNAGLTAKQARRFIDDPAYAKQCIDQLPKEVIDRFAKYKKLLFSIAKQASDLREQNRQMPAEFQIADSEFDSLGTNSDHVQMYEDLEFLLISLGDFKRTQKLFRLQTKLTHGIWFSDRFRADEDSFVLHETAADYFYKEAGIYRLRINLAANWERRSVDQIWERDLKAGKKLNAGSLGNVALNVQDRKLLRLQDGIHLPYHDHADQIRSGGGPSRAPYSFWDGVVSEVYFSSSVSDDVGSGYSAPALVE